VRSVDMRGVFYVGLHWEIEGYVFWPVGRELRYTVGRPDGCVAEGGAVVRPRRRSGAENGQGTEIREPGA
jgi:hypothetical protein